ncbi:Uncharacterised protein [Mycobacteroides abscessus subsp. abscessus]|nr:Uncharacterised protein [Mycobacteroides abscessus subsp. abscessus]
MSRMMRSCSRPLSVQMTCSSPQRQAMVVQGVGTAVPACGGTNAIMPSFMTWSMWVPRKAPS